MWKFVQKLSLPALILALAMGLWSCTPSEEEGETQEVQQQQEGSEAGGDA